MAELIGDWVKIEQIGAGPGARSSHAVSLLGRKAYVFGGEFSPRVPVDNLLHVFDLEEQIWSVVEVLEGAPPLPRVGVTMTAVGDIIFVFGGRDAEHNELDEFYSFDTASRKWSLLSSGDSSPPARSYHSMAADGACVYVFGGCGVSGRLSDLWAFDVGGGKWAKLPDPGPICLPRGGPGLAVVGGGIWVVYGFGGMELDDIHRFDLEAREWSVVETSGEKPSARSVFSSAGVGKYVFVYGGEVDPSDLGHLGAGQFSAEMFALDTEARVWRRVSAEAKAGDHPGARGWCAFSAGKKGGRDGLLVYGGNSPTNDRLHDLFFFFTPSSLCQE